MDKITLAGWYTLEMRRWQIQNELESNLGYIFILYLKVVGGSLLEQSNNTSKILSQRDPKVSDP